MAILRSCCLFPVLLLLVACGAAPKSLKEAAAKPPVPVEVAVAEMRDVPRTLRAVGTVAASETVVVRPRVSGELRTVHVREGAMVAAGDPLFELDDRPFAAAVSQAEAEVERARAVARQAEAVLARDRAQLSLAESEVRRNDDLERQVIVSAHQADQARSAVTVAQAAIAADEAAIATAQAAVRSAEATVAKVRLDLAWCRITAPIAGRTGALGITQGNLAVAGQTALLTIVATRPIDIDFALPADALATIRAAQGGSATRLAITARPGDGSDSEPGELALIDNQIDAASGTIRLRATCANAADRLWPGQQCRVDLQLGIERGVLTVPQKALQAAQKGSLVWVVAADRTVAPRPVTVARTVGDRVLITGGLQSGETVVTDGQLRLVRGATVAAIEAAPRPSAKPEGGAARSRP